MGLMTNFLSLKEMFLISLQGNPIFGVNLQENINEKKNKKKEKKDRLASSQRKYISENAVKPIIWQHFICAGK